MRRAARVDDTQAEIVAALRAEGASVWIIGLPVDLLVGVNGRTVLVECKRLEGKKIPKPAAYTKLQKAFMLDWCGGAVATLTDAQGARHLVAALKGEGLHEQSQWNEVPRDTIARGHALASISDGSGRHMDDL